MRPYVVVHVAVSLDGMTTGFDADLARFYELAATWHEDVTLTGADTVLAQESALAEGPNPGPAKDGPGHVDLPAALEALGTLPGVEVIRVDSGGALTGALLNDRLVDEVSLLIHPVWVGAGVDPRWHGDTPSESRGLELVAHDRIDHLVWLRYRFTS
jgi:2,5-diamino-6-(ribosylamino)-4(3H)-pyrimidinone 5'-phosphate reductase